MQYKKINEVQLSLNEMCRQKNEQDKSEKVKEKREREREKKEKPKHRRLCNKDTMEKKFHSHSLKHDETWLEE